MVAPFLLCPGRCRVRAAWIGLGPDARGASLQACDRESRVLLSNTQELPLQSCGSIGDPAFDRPSRQKRRMQPRGSEEQAAGTRRGFWLPT